MAEHRSNGNVNLKTFDAHVPEIKFTKLFIDGEFVDSVKGRTFETKDPRNGQVVARVAEGDEEDVDLAVIAARRAFDHGPWPRMPGYQRGRIMSKFADLIEENIDELAALDTIDAGKLFSVGKARDIPNAAMLLRYYAGAVDKIHGEVLKMSRELHGYTLREPVGVIGHIIPWNFPTGVFFMKVAPTLAAGCTMIVKPAEQTPLSALFYAHLAKKAGVPDGVINVVTGFGPTAGAAISSHMDIDMVSFTGSTKVGHMVMQAAATSNLKQVSLELGGKSPLIVFDDADLDTATDLALTGILYNKGEVCVAGSRVYVQEAIYEEFEKKLVAKAKAWPVGDPFDPNVRQGPQEDNVIVKDEIFGPVMSLMKFKTMEEVIKRANDTRYGLAAGILTKNIDLANTVSRSIRAGMIWINCYLAVDNDCPYGGYKMSGFGKDLGLDALHKYLHVKSIVTPIYNSPWL
ncbi:aldehyde dehydrogenase family 2 member C4 isoform X2 [Eucalyptus grandis]|uniref:aldehyde dehydrogenase family 2 member C4 isoform X2 n=1 Tax=Eucalyptus grandis TaxID=71139 RepID=UPI00192E8300|nr:aldehyde dehydrogenase family 2 member C4 isoform X2 [Eucalyptus grandis]